MNIVFSIAAGGAIGAVLRHYVGVLSLHLFGSHYPWGTLSVNIIGSFIMGALIAYFADVWTPAPEIRSFLTVGLLGAFTTFSTFSLDFMTLWSRGDIYAALAYMVISVLFSILSLVAGMFLIRQVVL